MSAGEDVGRRYSDEEFALILRKASEISEVGDGSHPDGLSLSEIQQIAAEAGIDSSAIARAAAGLPEQSRDKVAAIIGGPLMYRHERTLPGKISEEGLSKILQTVRRTASRQGETKHVLDSLEWQTEWDEPSQIFVNVSARDSGTTIEVVGDRRTAGALTVLLPTIGSFMGSMILGEKVIEPTTALGVVGILGGVFGSAAIVSRSLWSRTSASFQRRLGAIMEEASRTAEDALEEERSEPTALGTAEYEGGSAGE
jgi:hypothetical protein